MGTELCFKKGVAPDMDLPLSLRHKISTENSRDYAAVPERSLVQSIPSAYMSGHLSPSTQPTAIPRVLAEFRVGVDNVIFSVDTAQNRLLVLLVRRQQAPFLGEWSLPGTLVRAGESLEGAAYRILSEQIQVHNLYLEQLFTFSEPNWERVDAEGTHTGRYLSVSYFALVRLEDAQLIRPEDQTIAWHSVLLPPPLAFQQDQILHYGHRRLCNKLEYSPVAFEVLPTEFTLFDLYHFYSTVLGDGFSDYSNFRSRLLKLGFLRDTGQKVSRGAGRPASLYRFDADAFAPLKDKPLVFI